MRRAIAVVATLVAIAPGASHAAAGADSATAEREAIARDMRLRDLRAAMSTADSAVVARLEAVPAGNNGGGRGALTSRSLRRVSEAHVSRAWTMSFADALAHDAVFVPETPCRIETWPTPGADQLVVNVRFESADDEGSSAVKQVPTSVEIRFHERCISIREGGEPTGRVEAGGAAMDSLLSVVRNALPADPVVRAMAARRLSPSPRRTTTPRPRRTP